MWGKKALVSEMDSSPGTAFLRNIEELTFLRSSTYTSRKGVLVRVRVPTLVFAITTGEQRESVKAEAARSRDNSANL